MSPDDEAPPQPVEEEDFAALFAASLAPAVFETGQMVQGVVVLISRDVVFVDVGGKGEATMDRAELQDDDGQLTVEVGATVEAVVVSTSGGVTLSHKLARGAATRRQLEDAYRAQLPVEGRVAKTNKGGYEVGVGGQRAFCPISQIDTGFTSDPEVHVGQLYTFRIIDVGQLWHLPDTKGKARTSSSRGARCSKKKNASRRSRFARRSSPAPTCLVVSHRYGRTAPSLISGAVFRDYCTCPRWAGREYRTRLRWSNLATPSPFESLASMTRRAISPSG